MKTKTTTKSDNAAWVYLLWTILILVTLGLAALGSSVRRVREKFDNDINSDANSAAPFRQKEMILTDQDTHLNMWNAITPSQVDIANDNGRRVIFSTGDSPTAIQELLDTNVTDAEFPSVEELNDPKLYVWKAYKPRIIPRDIRDEALGGFIRRSTFWDLYGYYLVNYRITHANVSEAGDMLMTLQIIVHRESTVYAKAIEYDVLYQRTENKDVGSCLFTRAKVIGVIHEQYIRKDAAALVAPMLT